MVYDGYNNYGGLLFMTMMSMMVIDIVYDGYNNYDGMVIDTHRQNRDTRGALWNFSFSLRESFCMAARHTSSSYRKPAHNFLSL